MNLDRTQQRLRTVTLALTATAAVALTAGIVAVAARPAAPDTTARASAVTAYETADNNTATVREATGRTREFTLEVHRIMTEIAPGVKVEQWAYGFPGQQPSVPGPTIQVTQGERVIIHFRNTHDQPHTVHLHGIARLAQNMDGLTDVMPGDEATYEFVATDAGTFAYHCHYQTYLHADMGMYGVIVVEPRDQEAKVWKEEHAMVLDEWDSRQNPAAPVHHSEPNYFLINGKSFPLIPDITIAQGRTDLIRVANMGEEVHSLHLHGNTFLEIARNGVDLPQPVRGDTLVIAPGERADILVKGRDGSFPFHDHIVKDVTNGGIYPGGIHLMINGGPALDSYGQLAKGASVHSHMTTSAAPASGEAGEKYPDDSPAHNHVYDHLPKDTKVQVVDIDHFAFDRKELHVKVGTKVAWVNRDAVGHSVTAGLPGGDPKTRAFDSSNESGGTPVMLKQGEAWTYTFTKKGTYTYYCLPHTNMTAKVVVE
ncbi:multicopper oxidase domain-containing protein [Deinococcus pimensis]|uniref:multicopper oxidase domain-containing protein n=1 Tax=Deinococcus pimensis TaxID=309888 RepID=UPI0004AD3DA7|nr:multicopper oxidase domain-containing protein [Deinococcus pimensis]